MKTFILLFITLWPLQALAHKPSDSYLRLDAGNNGVSGRWDIALRDLDMALNLDSNGDNTLTWGELRTRAADVYALATRHLNVQTEGKPCPLAINELLVDRHSDGHYAVLLFDAACPQPAVQLDINYSLLFDLDTQHRGLLKLTTAQTTQSAVLAPGNAQRSFQLGTQAHTGDTLREFIGEGIWHIWIGYDHILFLLSLLLPAVLCHVERGWLRHRELSPAFWDVLKVVTAFTLAHSVTLSLATLGYVNLPSRWVESAIAASVVVAALNNLAPLLPRQRAALAFAFGLIHGLGFASVLSALELGTASRLWSLLGFNLGVEIGQLALVAIFLPTAFLLSRYRFYESAILKAGSAGIAGIASVWLLQRAFDW